MEIPNLTLKDNEIDYYYSTQFITTHTRDDSFSTMIIFQLNRTEKIRDNFFKRIYRKIAVLELQNNQFQYMQNCVIESGYHSFCDDERAVYEEIVITSNNNKHFLAAGDNFDNCIELSAATPSVVAQMTTSIEFATEEDMLSLGVRFKDRCILNN